MKLAEFFEICRLEEFVNNLPGTFYVLSSNKNEQIKYEVFVTQTTLAKTDRLEGEDNPGEITKVEKSAGASAGAYLAATGKTGYLTSGPYLHLDPGRYEVSFAVKSAKKSSDEVRFDATAFYGRDTLAGKDVTLGELSSQDFQKVTLGFELDEPADSVEFRLEVPANSTVGLDYLELVKQS